MSNDTVVVLQPLAPEVIEVGYATGSPSHNTVVAVDAQRRDASFTMPTETNPFVWDNVAVDTGGIYNPVTGITTIPFTGIYTFNFAFSVSAGTGTDILYAFAQTSVDGIVWTTSTYSGRRLVISTQGQQLLMASTNKFTQGTKLRFVFFSTSPSTTIGTVNVPQSTAIVPAARLLITGISE